MESIAVAAGTTLVGALAGDGWPAARAEVVAFWRRVRADEADAVADDLAELRAEVLAARQAGDPELERALVEIWQRRFQELLRPDPELAGELRSIVDRHLTPTLTPAERADQEERRDRPR
ncbi:hypothetical protein I0C86_33905 [Plantactinospora sp. S1510]|uniref:Albicidin resistance protein n=1 Tax=Plantactinospora alkalitolerans TaxID=2789879 RepID=A0ABS0H5Z5_9ACTN|nr:hypothetical protein [Plantactinospora alkalitolerans]MBF9133894.1 hypothetical protein [Plantactinospora alkalitolerans]